jgi:hypothetical protein
VATYSLIPILDPAPPAEGGALFCLARSTAAAEPSPAPLSTPQKRASVRSKAFLKALIRLENGDVTIDCVVRNISLSGAKLGVPRMYVVPTKFELEIPQRGAALQCVLKWRKDDEVGVEFLDSTELLPHAPRAQSMEDLRRENARLGQEIVRLKLRVEELTVEP